MNKAVPGPLPSEIRERPVLSVNWGMIRFNPHLGRLLLKWPAVGVKVENGRPILYPSKYGFRTTYERGMDHGWLSQSVKQVFRDGGIPKDTRWVMVWDGKRLVGYLPEEAPQEDPGIETVSSKELAELRRLAEIGRRAEAITG